MTHRAYYTLILVLLLITACQSSPASAPMPTSAVQIVTLPPARTAATSTPTAAATDNSVVAPPVIGDLSTASSTAQATALALGTQATLRTSSNVIHLDNMLTNLRDGEILFISYITSQSAIKGASVSWTFTSSKKTGQKDAPLPPQRPGQSTQFQVALPLDALPQTESTLSYHWTLTDETGVSFTSPDGRFKLTEATRADQRDDLPVIDSVSKFDSQFPDHALFTVTLKPEHPITNARFFITQNHGIYVKDYEARVPTVDPGRPIMLSFSWNATFSLQIPWQQFETWWVVTDENGHIYRTKHELNDYADTRRHRWVRTPTKYAVLYTYSQSAANIALLVAATDHSVEALQKEFDYKLLYPPHIVIYNTIDDFKEWAPPVIEGQFIGMASGSWGGAVIGVYNSIRFTGYTIIKHELTHVFQFQSVQQAMPQWFLEGSARYMEELPEEDNEAVTRRLCKEYGAPSLQMPVAPFSPDRRRNAWPYYVGMSFIKYLKATYGDDAFARTYLALARNVDLATALQTVTGKTFDQIDKDWQKWIVQ